MHRFAIPALPAAALGASPAFAESPLHPEDHSVHQRSRSEVKTELAQFRSAPNPGSIAYDPLARFQSGLTRQQVRAAFIASRDEVAARTGEDSGSFAFGPSQSTHPQARVAASTQAPGS